MQQLDINAGGLLNTGIFVYFTCFANTSIMNSINGTFNYNIGLFKLLIVSFSNHCAKQN